MPSFGRASLAKLATVDHRIVDVLNEAIKLMDFTVTAGHRTLEEQQDLYAQGRTRPGSVVTKCDGVVRKSNHQSYPSVAVDIAPWPIDWGDSKRFLYLAGLVMGIAHMKGVPLVWGGDFNNNYDLNDDRFVDWPHFELRV